MSGRARRPGDLGPIASGHQMGAVPNRLAWRQGRGCTDRNRDGPCVCLEASLAKDGPACMGGKCPRRLRTGGWFPASAWPGRQPAFHFYDGGEGRPERVNWLDHRPALRRPMRAVDRQRGDVFGHAKHGPLDRHIRLRRHALHIADMGANGLRRYLRCRHDRFSRVPCRFER